jgi:hypothetical protein
MNRPHKTEAPAASGANGSVANGSGKSGASRREARYALERFSQTQAADAVNVPTLSRAVVGFAEAHGATPLALDRIRQAVDAALHDIVIQACPHDSAPRSMTIDAHRELTRLAVVVIDESAASAAVGRGRPVLMGFSLN